MQFLAGVGTGVFIGLIYGVGVVGFCFVLSVVSLGLFLALKGRG